jgi:hypothetical protein
MHADHEQVCVISRTAAGDHFTIHDASFDFAGELPTWGEA